MQKYTSSATSVNRAKLPAIYRRASLPHSMVLDYGCGKYTEHIEAHLRTMNKIYLPFDPFNQPDDVNKTTAYYLRLAQHVGRPVDVVCSNVLNVIDDDDTVRKIIRTIEAIVSRTGGTAYFTVYEGDRSGAGRATGTDQYQRNEPLRNYLRFFALDTTVKNGMIVVEC